MQVFVNAVGLIAVVGIAWYFWFSEKPGVKLESRSGIQEVALTVKGGYNPDVIVVKKGVPVRLHFTRQESALCSEQVIFDKIDQSAKLPEGETVTIEFTPEEAGEIPFQCQMGMLRGKVIVE